MKKLYLFLLLNLLVACTHQQDLNISTDPINTQQSNNNATTISNNFLNLENLKTCNQYKSAEFKDTIYPKLIFTIYRSDVNNQLKHKIYLPCKDNRILTLELSDIGIMIDLYQEDAYYLGESIIFNQNKTKKSFPFKLDFVEKPQGFSFISDDENNQYLIKFYNDQENIFDQDTNLKTLSQRNKGAISALTPYLLYDFKSAINNYLITLSTDTYHPIYKELVNLKNKISGVYYSKNGDLLSIYPNNQVLLLNYHKDNLEFKYLGEYKLNQDQIKFNLKDIITGRNIEVNTKVDDIKIDNIEFTKYQELKEE